MIWYKFYHITHDLFDFHHVFLCFKLNENYLNLLPLWKESLKSDVQQLHQYQQNTSHLTNINKTPLTSNYGTQKYMAYGVVNLGPGLGQAQQYDS